MGTQSGIEALARQMRDIEIHTEPHYTISYNYDATGLRGECGGVAFPEDLDGLRRIVLGARRHGVGLFVRGAGSGYSGGAVPLGGGLVVSMERMTKVLGFDPEAETVEVETGIVNGELQEYLQPFGFFYPPDPASLKFSTIGGNIAENAGGPRAYKYGVTRRYVRSVTWVTPGGDIATAPMEGPASLLIGAEGTMGIIYSAKLAVRPLPEAHRTSFLAAGDDRGAMGVASDLLATGFVPSVLEFIDSRTMRCVGEYRSFGGIDIDQSYLFIEIDGSDEVVQGLYGLLERFCRDGDFQLTTARSESERELLWEVRRSVSPSLARRGVTKVNEDVSLPLGKLGAAVSDIHALASELALDCYIFGHCGDGNLHVNIMTDKRRREEMERVETFVESLFHYVVKRGGTLSGEHGIGMTKSPYLSMIFSPSEMAMARALKRAIDEDGIFNNGKYFTA